MEIVINLGIQVVEEKEIYLVSVEEASQEKIVLKKGWKVAKIIFSVAKILQG